jgi:chemotaxis signal transduction protein
MEEEFILDLDAELGAELGAEPGTGSDAVLGGKTGAVLSELPVVESAAPTVTVQSQVGQAIHCGRWALALNFKWSNVIIDQFELVTIPRSPPWLIGAVNVDGGIVPVVDLSVYFDPEVEFRAIDRHNRLLLGGRTDGSNENAVALLFSGLPFQIDYVTKALEGGVDLPENLRQMCAGVARSASGESYFEIDTAKLLDQLSMSLM